MESVIHYAQLLILYMLYFMIDVDMIPILVSHSTFEKFFFAFSNVISFISQTACFAIRCYFVFRGELTVGALINALQLLNSVFQLIELIAEGIKSIKGSKIIKDKIDNFRNIIFVFRKTIRL